ncbi:MAG: amidohydrolase [Alphaproteobacteria bacterium]|nr:amidohydrolase [Alphaproteobacteria bacterium]
MPYIEGETIHDADSHVMELPGTLERYADPAFRAAIAAQDQRQDVAQLQRHGDDSWPLEMQRLHDEADFRAGFEEHLLVRKNYQATGAFRRGDRPLALDLLGFASQLVFTTNGLFLFDLEHGKNAELAIQGARAHNRMMADFCSVDRRLLAVAYVPLVDRARAVDVAREAINLGCKALMIPTRAPKTHSPSHKELDRLWALAQEAGLPILFHVGGEVKTNPAYFENGGPAVRDFHGGAENFTSVSFMGIPLSVWQTLSVLVFDGVFDRFPALKWGAIELGASWVPSLMQFMDSGAAAFGKEERLRQLSAKPSEILQRQFFATPYPHENTGWIIRNGCEDICLFSSDYPHVEGGRNPMKRFNGTMQGVSEGARHKFFRDNFITMMGAGLDVSLHGAPVLKAV